jgi:formylmethanofuran dehydrogenase subunit B
MLEPVASTYNRIDEVPVHVKEYVGVVNQEEMDYAKKLVENVKRDPATSKTDS